MNRRVVFTRLSALVLAAAVVGAGGLGAAAWAGGGAFGPAPWEEEVAGVGYDLVREEVPAPAEAPEVVAEAPEPASELGAITPLDPAHPLVTEEEVRAFLEATPWAADDPENAEVWLRQQVITIDCMAEKGWRFDPTSATAWGGYGADSAEFLALWGETGGGDAYRWEDAGCVGLAVHETGMDDAN